MFQQFINRTKELKILKDRYNSKKPEFLIVYGRRRVGKTELITHFIKNKPNIYFLAEEKRDLDNLKDFQIIIGKYLNDPEFEKIKFNDWTELFKSFSKKNKKRCVVVIDEFPYIVKRNSSVPSKFQKIWDIYLKNSNIVLIIVGSSVSMMEKLLGAESPLHGRRTGQLEIKPMSMPELKKFLPKYTLEDCIKIYGCVDGIPLYIKQFTDKKSFNENIKTAFLQRDSVLYTEAEILLKQEFRDTANYFSILKAISFGNTKHNEIVNYTDIDKSIISKYLQNLEKIRIIKKEYVITDRKEKRTNLKYGFTDNYFRFWFRFIYPNKTFIEKSEINEIARIIMRNYNTYLGFIFEEVVMDILWKIRPIQFTKIGRWWHKDKEIDLVALDEDKKEIGFFEVKWKDLKEKEARKILRELKEKSKFVNWNLDNRKEFFGVIAKKIENKNKLRKEGFFVYDLRDF